MLAEASDAIIIGFSVGVDKAAQVRAEASGIEIRRYDIIYKMIEDIEDALTGMLEPVYENVTIGHAEVLKIFKLRRGTIAGCRVRDGIVKRNALARPAGQGRDRRQCQGGDAPPLRRRCGRSAHRLRMRHQAVRRRRPAGKRHHRGLRTPTSAVRMSSNIRQERLAALLFEELSILLGGELSMIPN